MGLFVFGCLCLALVYLLVALIGSHEWCANTLLGKISYTLTDGVFDAIEDMVPRLCGHRGVVVFSRIEAMCCGQASNPIGQMAFLLFFFGSWLGVYYGVFPLLAVNALPTWHQWTGAVVASLVLFSFVVLSTSDPGRITNDNIAYHLALYPPDGEMFKKDDVCLTCLLPKPGRSKHCNASKACIARYDHWCIWINNAVGLLNMQWFLIFLLTTLVGCCYGAVMSFMVVSRDMKRAGAWDMEWWDDVRAEKIRMETQWGLLIQYVLSRYGAAAGTGAFLGAAALILLGFGCVTLRRIYIGETTNESYKRLAASVDSKRYPYDRGWRQNFAEVLFVQHSRTGITKRTNKSRDKDR